MTLSATTNETVVGGSSLTAALRSFFPQLSPEGIDELLAVITSRTRFVGLLKLSFD